VCAAATMSYIDPSVSRRGKPSLLSRTVTYIQLMYYRYEVTFSPYVMSHGEKIVMNTIVVTLLSLLLLGIVSYLPQLLTRASLRLFWLYTGADDQLLVGSIPSTGREMGPEFGH